MLTIIDELSYTAIPSILHCIFCTMKLTNTVKVYSLVPAYFLCILQTQSIAYSVMSSHHTVLVEPIRVTRSFTIWGASWKFLTNNAEKDSPHLALGLFLITNDF